MKSLAERMAEVREMLSAQSPPEIRNVFQASAVEVANLGIREKAVAEGEQAPDFSLPNAFGTTMRLGDLLARGPVVLSFYRGGWCPFCNTALRALQEAAPEIRSLGATLLAISPQTQVNSRATVEKAAITFDVLSDAGNAVSRAYGLVFKVPGSLRTVYETMLGIDLPASNGDSSFELPVPATYVLERSGRVRLAHVDPDYTSRLEPKDIVLALRSLS